MSINSLNMSINTDEYRWTGPPPVAPNEIFQVGKYFYKTVKREILYYPFKNRDTSGADLGMTTTKYNVTDLTPTKELIYFINSWGIDGRIQAQIYYPTGQPRNTPEANALFYLTSKQAHWLSPLTMRFALVQDDVLAVSVYSPISPTAIPNTIWFYGWKITVQPLGTSDAGQNAKVLDDFRSI